MASKPIRLRAIAAADLETTASHYRDRAGEEIALGFIDDVQQVFGLIASDPGIGSLRYGYDLDIAGLRAFPLERFDHAVFYVETDDVVDVWRILHTRHPPDARTVRAVADSDIDLVVVRPNSTDGDDDAWSSLIEQWRNGVRRLTGNPVAALEVSADEAASRLAGRSPLWREIRRDGRVVHGVSLDQLLAPSHA